MAASSYDQSLRRLLIHEGGYTNDAADPGGPTKFGITIHDYRKYVKPNATAADVRAMKVDEAKSIYRTKYWDAQRCDELPAGVDYAVFDYGVNSGIGRSGKVLRRMLKLPDKSSAVTDAVIAGAKAVDAKALVAAICDERLRFLQCLRTWPVFGKGWGRRVAEVKATALAMAKDVPVESSVSAHGKTVAPAAKGALQGMAAVIAAGGAVAAHQAGMRPAMLVAVAAAVLVPAVSAWLLWRSIQTKPGEIESMWNTIKAWFRNSVTILWARVQVLAGLIAASLLAIASDPNVTGAIQAALQPKFIPYYVIAIGLVTEVARRRTAGRA
jgi:lysozyme family protein